MERLGSISANDSIPAAPVRKREQIHNGDLVGLSRTSRLPIFNPINALKKSIIVFPNLESVGGETAGEQSGYRVFAARRLPSWMTQRWEKLPDIISLHKGRIRNLFVFATDLGL